MTELVVLDGHTVNPGDNPWDELSQLGNLTVYDRSETEQVVARAARAEIVLVNKTVLTREVLSRLPRVQGVFVLATGVNSVDLAAASERGIPVCNVPSYSTAAVVQHTLALLLELCQHVGVHDESVHRGDWLRSLDYCYWKRSVVELDGKLLGVVGYGAIGQGVGNAARALGMQVCAATLPSARPHDRSPSSVTRLPLDELFRTADVISLHCPLTAGTAELVSRARLELVKPECLLINTARGGLIDERALRDALDSGRLAGAALDVLSEEPPKADQPLLRAPNCIITPHIAWTSLPARQRLIRVTVDNVRALLARAPIHVVNPSYERHAQ